MYNVCAKGVTDVCPKMGRPKVDNAKTLKLNVKIDKETLDKIEEIASANSLTKGQVVRQGIECLYRHIKK